MTPSTIALGFGLVLYLLGAVISATNLFLRKPALLAGGRLLAGVAVGLHTAAIGLRCVELKTAPFATPSEALSALAWMVALAYLLSEALWRLSAVGPFALGLSFLLVLGAGVAPAYQGTPSPALLGSRAIGIHITATLAAIGVFSLAFCCAALYLVEHHILKSKHGLVWLKRLPPLSLVENAAFSLVAVGFPLLTLGILSGLLRAQGSALSYDRYLDTHSLLAFTVWAVYGSYLLARRAAWPPVRRAYVLLIGLALCLLLFFAPPATHPFG